MNKFMQEAIKEAYIGINNSHGGPFGAVVVKDGKIIGKGHNCVLKCNDPTMHGEIVAIKDACKYLGTYNLSGCEIYTSAEPCPMCLGAILWAGIKKVYYGCNRTDSKKIGFNDDIFYNIINNKSGIEFKVIDKNDCLDLFKKYNDIDNKIIY